MHQVVEAFGGKCIQKRQCIAKPNLQSHFLYPHNTEFPSMKNIIGDVDQLTDGIIPEGPAQKRARHQASLPYSSTVLPSPFPTHPGSPNLVDSRLEISSINHARPRTDDILTNRGRCTSFAPLPVTTPTDSMRCRPDRHTPK